MMNVECSSSTDPKSKNFVPPLQMTPPQSQKLAQLPPYLFSMLDQIKKEKELQGIHLHQLSIGDPDIPTPQPIISAMIEALKDSHHHRYPSYKGLPAFLEAANDYMYRRFNVPKGQVLALLGTKEGLAHSPFAFFNKQDAVLIPNPAYPVYAASLILAGIEAVEYSLEEKNNFLPDFKQLEQLLHKHPNIKAMVLNYPNNPTGATASLEFFQELVDFALKKGIYLMHDNAYAEISFTGKPQPSLLQAQNAIDCAIEFHSLSKSFNMAGWRLGFVCGQLDMIESLAKFKTQIDSGCFHAIQQAGAYALNHAESLMKPQIELYSLRKENLAFWIKNTLNYHHAVEPEAGLYFWLKVNQPSLPLCLEWIEKHKVIATPGVGFGTFGEGYVRLTFAQNFL